MNTQLKTEILPFVAVLHGELKTTSLKIAEHFGKRHTDVIRAIESLECPPEFRERNFALSEYISEQNKKLPCYELSKDGFVFAAMGFTGKKAARWKVAYINAFNAIAEELSQVKSLKNSFKLIEPPTITNAQQGQLHALVADKARATNKFNSYFWSRFLNHFKLSSYKLLPYERFEEAMEFLRRLEGDASDSFVMLSHKELNGLIKENDEAINCGEARPKEATNSITLTLAPSDKVKRWLITQAKPEVVILLQLTDDMEVITKETFIRQLIHDDYIVMKKDDFINKLQQ
jgi:Rha family phage regulatory protein